MAARGHGPYEGRSIQAPGMMRHGPVPGVIGHATHRPLEPLPPLELLEGKIAAQAAEIERLLRENQRLAATNEGMRHDISVNQQEVQRIKSHIGTIRTEADIQARGLVEKIRKVEDDIRAGDAVKEEMQQAHKDAKSLIIINQELTGEIHRLTEELQKASGDGKRLSELLAELDGLRQEHHKLCGAFERAKGMNVEQVEQMRAMEKNLISLAREIEKLRADVTSAEKGERVNPYAGTYGSPGIGYSHGHGGAYSNAELGYGRPAEYTQAYGQPLPHVPGGAPKGNGAGYGDVYARYQTQMGSAAVAGSGAGYSDVHVKPRVPGAAGGVAAGEGMNLYGGVVGAVSNPKKPFAAIVGGSKVSSKIGVIESLLEKVDILILGGGMIFTFYKAQGHSVGSSLVEEDKLSLATALLEKAKAKGVSLLLPTDVVIADKFAADANSKIVPATAIPDGWMGLDIGPDSIKTFNVSLDTTKTVIWNGPMGVFEFDKFAAGTEAIAKKLAELTGNGVTTIIGGGDSVAAVEKAGLAEKMSHISTGGGASLELLEGKPLPGVLALDDA